MASRYNIPSDTSMKPGPGAHRPEKVMNNKFNVIRELNSFFSDFS